MINDGILVLCLLNFGFIALLPYMFFKKGDKLNLQWWMTAGPMFACPAILALAFYGIFPPFVPYDSPWTNVLSYAAVFSTCFSILMLGFSIGAHRAPIYMFHDTDDNSHKTKAHLVTYGPYRYIRHPIYAAYLLGLWSAFFFHANVGTLICLIWGMIVLNVTAAKEERRLCESSDLGAEYTEYMTYTGRFIPPLSSISVLKKHQEAVLEKKATPAPPQPQHSETK